MLNSIRACDLALAHVADYSKAHALPQLGGVAVCANVAGLSDNGRQATRTKPAHAIYPLPHGQHLGVLSEALFGLRAALVDHGSSLHKRRCNSCRVHS